MNEQYVTDTMALILHLEKRKLSQNVKNIFNGAENGKVEIFIPAMVIAEIGYLAERNKIDTDLYKVQDFCKKYSSFQIESISADVILKTFEIDDIPELHDRIIAGTAFLKNLQLITNDPIIIDSKFISTIW